MTGPRRPDDKPRKETPSGPRTPYPVEHPGIGDQAGTEPDYIPATPNELPKL